MTFLLPPFSRWENRYREVEGLAQGHTAAKWMGLDVHDILLNEKSILQNIMNIIVVYVKIMYM